MVAQASCREIGGGAGPAGGGGCGETGARALAAGQHLPVSTEPRRLSVWSLRLG